MKPQKFKGNPSLLHDWYMVNYKMGQYRVENYNFPFQLELQKTQQVIIQRVKH
jgi:hypothetical protein